MSKDRTLSDKKFERLLRKITKKGVKALRTNERRNKRALKGLFLNEKA